MNFVGALAQGEAKTMSSRIWTQVTDSILTDNNRSSCVSDDCVCYTQTISNRTWKDSEVRIYQFYDAPSLSLSLSIYIYIYKVWSKDIKTERWKF